ncbi:hypothetical protein DFH09DRAFT_1223311 [Mycena vulgaris]|nr:hypothetical protein DFH09DRAFT_1223311 [Mycena vulgaris]
MPASDLDATRLLTATCLQHVTASPNKSDSSHELLAPRLARPLRDHTPGAANASFGVDTPTVSFGRDTSCSVRLYYPAVASTGARCTRTRTRKAQDDRAGERRYTGSGSGSRTRSKGCAPRARRPLPVHIPRPCILACH